MNVLDLDEAQGLTAEMVRQYMARTGWRPAESCTYECWIHDTLRPAAGAFVLREKIDGAWSVPTADDVALYVRDLAKLEGRTVSDLLREINPRMRPWPSSEAVEAHKKTGGRWLCVCREDETVCMGRFDGHWFQHSGNFVLEKRDRFALYWPCDQHGQRVRWPEKDGVML